MLKISNSISIDLRDPQFGPRLKPYSGKQYYLASLAIAVLMFGVIVWLLVGRYKQRKQRYAQSNTPVSVFVGCAHDNEREAAEQKQQETIGMIKYCLVCEKEFGPSLNAHCTDSSLVAIRKEGSFKTRTLFFALDGRELNEDELSHMRDVEIAKIAKGAVLK